MFGFKKLPWWVWVGWALLAAMQVRGLLVDWRTPGLVSPYMWARPWLLLLWGVLGGLLWRVRAERWNTLLFRSSGPVFYGLAAGLAFCLYLFVSLAMYHGIPRLDDGIAAVYQSELFLRGQIVTPAPPEADFFKMYCFIGPWNMQEGWEHLGIDWICGMYAPGWSLLAMPFTAVGATWLLNPLLGAALVPATAWLGREVFDARTGRVAALLTLGSPFVASMAGTHLGHVLTALCMVLCTAAVWRMLRSGGLRWGLLAGTTFHLAFLTRSVTTLLIGLMLGLLVLVRWRDALRAWPAVLATGLIGATAAGTLGWYQAHTTSDWKTMGHKVGMGQWGGLGFNTYTYEDEDTGKMLPWRYSPTKAVRFSLGRVQGADYKTLGWPVGLLALCLLAFATCGRRWTMLWLFAPTLLLLLFFFFFWYEEVYWRGRYLFAGLPFLLLSVAHCLSRLTASWRIPLCVCAAFVVAVGLPAELGQYHDGYGDIDPAMLPLVERSGIENAIVHVKNYGRDYSAPEVQNKYYSTGWLQNGIALDASVLFVHDLGARNADLWKHYPDRKVYTYTLNRETRAAELTDATGKLIDSAYPPAK